MNDPHDNAQTDREALERHRPETLTHAVTRPQPEAWALASGLCPVIPSDTRPGLEHEGKLIGIHAGRRRACPGVTRVQEFAARIGRHPTSDELAQTEMRGTLIGVARLVGVVYECEQWVGREERAVIITPTPVRGVTLQYRRLVGRSRVLSDPLNEWEHEIIRPWWPPGTRYGLLLSEAVLLSEPIPMRGAGGLWWLPTGGGGMWNRGDGERLLTASEWALEQWRKGRAER